MKDVDLLKLISMKILFSKFHIGEHLSAATLTKELL